MEMAKGDSFTLPPKECICKNRRCPYLGDPVGDGNSCDALPDHPILEGTSRHVDCPLGQDAYTWSFQGFPAEFRMALSLAKGRCAGERHCPACTHDIFRGVTQCEVLCAPLTISEYLEEVDGSNPKRKEKETRVVRHPTCPLGQSTENFEIVVKALREEKRSI